MAKAIVSADVYRYHEKHDDPDSPILEAAKGDEIDVSEAELKRGLALHEDAGFGLVKPRSSEAKDAKAEAAEDVEAEPAS
jgi:hypothetical protein